MYNLRLSFDVSYFSATHLLVYPADIFHYLCLDAIQAGNCTSNQPINLHDSLPVFILTSVCVSTWGLYPTDICLYKMCDFSVISLDLMEWDF